MSELWSDKQVLVTGAGGFVGSHLVEQLVKNGARVRAFVRYNSRGNAGLLHQLEPSVISQVEVIAGDLRDEDAVRQAVAGCGIVYHLGALISIPYSYRHPAEVASTNIMGTLNVLLACRDQAVQRLVHTSTSEVYGTARITPIAETHPIQGQSPYSASKIGADKLVESFYCAYGLPVITVRPFNTYGPRQSARAVIPTIITQALVCDSVKLGNQDTTRDFTYIDDTVAGFLLAGASPVGLGEVFNLGTGIEIRIGDLVHKIMGLIGRELDILTEEQRLRPKQSEVLRLISDNLKARQILGWEPRITLDQGLGLTISWIRDHLDQYQAGRYEF